MGPGQGNDLIRTPEHQLMSLPSSTSPRRRERVWRASRNGYRPKRVACVIAVVVSLLVIAVTLLYGQLRKTESAGPPSSRFLSEGDNTSG